MRISIALFGGTRLRPLLPISGCRDKVGRGALVEWYWQKKTEVLWENPVPVRLHQPQISHGPTGHRTPVSPAKGRHPTAWNIASPSENLHYCKIYIYMSFVRHREHSLRYKDQGVVLLREIMAVSCKTQAKYTNTPCWKGDSRRCMYLLLYYSLPYYANGLITGDGRSE
jgi:hypothetical protein